MPITNASRALGVRGYFFHSFPGIRMAAKMFFVVLQVLACIPRRLLIDDLHNPVIDLPNKLAHCLTCQGTTLCCAVKAEFCGASELPLSTVVVAVVVVVVVIVIVVVTVVVVVVRVCVVLLPVAGGEGKGIGRYEWEGLGGVVGLR